MKDYNTENNSQLFPFLLRTEFGLLPFTPERHSKCFLVMKGDGNDEEITDNPEKRTAI